MRLANKFLTLVRRRAGRARSRLAYDVLVVLVESKRPPLPRPRGS